MKPGETKACPKCNGVAVDITPLKQHADGAAVLACQTCGYAFRTDGAAFVRDGEALRDVFRGATLANQTLEQVFVGKEALNPATRSLLLARLVEYGLCMWMDGVKQGIVLGTIRSDHDNGKAGN